MVKKNIRKIVVQEDGPYTVQGNIPLVRKEQVVSEYGEPLTWKKTGTIETPKTYDLCRCGRSRNKPFCDLSHFDFDGTETADTAPTAARQFVIPGGREIVVKQDIYLCTESGFCANRLTDVEKMVPETGDTQVRAQVMAMIERCPSGSFVYSIEQDEPDIEPDLPVEIAVTVEIISDGPIPGPLWVTGNIPVERSDGKPFETRNRVTLCNCGESKNKPLCDGTHRNQTR
jgi:CDGSH-type Zn-finger protein